jgi:predicted DNA-binding protein YlxM (UPF0122 family)
MIKLKISKEELIKLYSIDKLSMKKIADLYNGSPQTIMRMIHEYNIPLNKYPLAWNSGKTYLDDNRILAKEKHPCKKNIIYYNSDFKRLRKELLPCKCNRCENIAIIIHHKDGNKMNNNLNNLEPLCSSCHSIHHNKTRGITVYKHICENPLCKKEFIILNNRKCNQKYCSKSCDCKHKYSMKKSFLYKYNTKNI